MAQLQPKQRFTSSSTGLQNQHAGFQRYYLDRARLLNFFGGQKRLKELTKVYGLPGLNPASGNGASEHKGIPITLNNVLLMLELAERMHKPLDLYQFLCEER